VRQPIEEGHPLQHRKQPREKADRAVAQREENFVGSSAQVGREVIDDRVDPFVRHVFPLVAAPAQHQRASAHLLEEVVHERALPHARRPLEHHRHRRAVPRGVEGLPERVELARPADELLPRRREVPQGHRRAAEHP
jgi:hypothetical protein